MSQREKLKREIVTCDEKIAQLQLKRKIAKDKLDELEKEEVFKVIRENKIEISDVIEALKNINGDEL